MVGVHCWAERPTHISAVATVLLITKTFVVKYYDRKIQTNTASIIITITHVKRDSDCHRNEKDSSEKQLGGKVNNKIYMQMGGGGLGEGGMLWTHRVFAGLWVLFPDDQFSWVATHGCRAEDDCQRHLLLGLNHHLALLLPLSAGRHQLSTNQIPPFTNSPYSLISVYCSSLRKDPNLTDRWSWWNAWQCMLYIHLCTNSNAVCKHIQYMQHTQTYTLLTDVHTINRCTHY